MILDNLEAGASIDDIMEWFDGLDRAQVRALVDFVTLRQKLSTANEV